MTTDHSELDGLSLTELTHRLRDIHTQRTPLGWPTEEAVTKSAIERRIMELVTRLEPQPIDDAAQRIPCELDLKIRIADRPSIRAQRATVQPGGLFVEITDEIAIGQTVEIEVTTDSKYRVHGRGVVGFRAHGKAGQGAGVGIGFSTVVGDSDERRLERLILEIIRNRSH